VSGIGLVRVSLPIGGGNLSQKNIQVWQKMAGIATANSSKLVDDEQLFALF
jgi:hypothetical protein